MDTIQICGARIMDPSTGMDKIGDIWVENGKIAALATEGEKAGEASVRIDAGGLVAAPGLVDMHVHLRDPGQTEKEDIVSGCRAAAAGGVTSLLCMPNTRPALDTPELVHWVLEKAKQADARVYCACCITQGLGGQQPADLGALREAGAIACTDDGRPVENTAVLAQAMQAAPLLGMRVVAHCEDLYLAAGGLMNEGEVSRTLGVKGIPAAAEDAGTAREIALAAAYGVPVHICHVSTATSVELIRDAKRRGVAVTAETAPHYFLLTEQSLLERDADYRMNPPLRTEQDRLAIIRALADGTLDAVATDHAPHTPQEKADFNKAPNGSIGMETSLAAGITALVQPGELTLMQLLEKMSTAPARILGIDAGSLRVGGPADLVLFDPNEAWTVDPQKLHGKSRNTPFKGMTLTGRVRYTICRGRLVFQA
ncbi:MAG TPA: dihydroorotase [Candidatus Gallacutalibacter stercoravium]|nr:dihydroorotase [Candidatus Gallacutalibacter stercoravium]